jgi:hypothetical protein
MMILRRTTGLLALAACLVAAGCGSDDEGEPIPANIADQLQTRLNEIERRFDFGNGACSDIENDSRPAVDQLVASVPENVSADVRQALRDGFDRLFALSEDQCNRGEQTETETEPETEAAPAPLPETEETTTVTVPPDTTETAPPPETEPAPPETEEQIPPGQGGDAPGGGEGGDGNSGQGGSGSGQGGSGSGPNGAESDSGGVLVPEGEG